MSDAPKPRNLIRELEEERSKSIELLERARDAIRDFEAGRKRIVLLEDIDTFLRSVP